MKIETVMTDHFSLDYFKFGHGDHSLVILPGLRVQSVMGFAASVAAAYDNFADDFTVYVFDRRKELSASYSIHDMAQDTAEAIKKLCLSRVNVFGASQGGMIAMDMAIEEPELINKLALGSTSASVDQVQYKTIEKWIQLAKSGDKTGLYLAFGEAIYPEATFEQLQDLLTEMAETVTDEDLKRFIILAEGMKGFDVTDQLKDIECPVLVIGSMDDQVLGFDACVRIAKNLNIQQSVVLYMYNGYGHAVYDIAPDYRERLLQFFNS